MSGISKYQLIYLDTPCFVYQLGKNPHFSAITHQIFQEIEVGKAKGITSVVSVLEFFVKPEKDQNKDEIIKFENFFVRYPNLRIIPVSWEIARAASRIRAEYQLRTPDSIQLATAQFENADAFITNDKRLKKFKEIQVLVLSDFV